MKILVQDEDVRIIQNDEGLLTYQTAILDSWYSFDGHYPIFPCTKVGLDLCMKKAGLWVNIDLHPEIAALLQETSDGETIYTQFFVSLERYLTEAFSQDPGLDSSPEFVEFVEATMQLRVRIAQRNPQMEQNEIFHDFATKSTQLAEFLKKY